MNSIESIKDFIKEVKASEDHKYGTLMKNINIPLNVLEECASWDEECYTRNCIYYDNDFELILICWEKGQETPIHNHDNQKCWVYQLKGQISEVRYEKESNGRLVETNQIRLNPGKLTFMNTDMGYHKLKNDSEGKSMTLHLYASPIKSCEVYNDEKGVFESKKLQYDSIREVTEV